MSTTDQTAEEMFDSLTGFDEIAICKAFGQDISAMADKSDPERRRPFTFMRALVFVHLRRASEPRLKDPQAFEQAMRLTLGEVQAYFADDEPEFDPDDPDTDQGKDGTPPE